MNTSSPTTNTTSDFERGARAAVEAFGAYFRTQDDVIFAGFGFYRDENNPSAGTDWRHYTDDEFEQFANGAIQDALFDERRRAENGA